MLKLSPSRTALVLIDLQEGILPFAGDPHSAADVVKRAAVLAQSFRDAPAPVLLVRVGWSADFAAALKQPVDSGSGGPLPANWWDIPFAPLQAQDSDIRVIKRQWGAFYGTDLEMQLRQRGIQTIVLGGISTNIGVESTAHNTRERGFEMVLMDDICSAHDEAQHNGSFQHIFPRLGRVRRSAEVLDRPGRFNARGGKEILLRPAWASRGLPLHSGDAMLYYRLAPVAAQRLGPLRAAYAGGLRLPLQLRGRQYHAVRAARCRASARVARYDAGDVSLLLQVFRHHQPPGRAATLPVAAGGPYRAILAIAACGFLLRRGGAPSGVLY